MTEINGSPDVMAEVTREMHIVSATVTVNTSTWR